MSKTRNYCAVDGCGSKRTNANSFFSLPKDGERRKKWIDVIGRPDLTTTKTKPTSNYVCSLHFKKSFIKYIPQLKADAVPTKSLPNQPSTSDQNTASTQTKESPLLLLQDESGESARKRKAMAAREELAEGESRGHVTCDKESASGEFRVRTHSSCSFPETNKFTLDQEVLMDLHELSDKMQNFYPAVQGKSFTVTFKGTDGDKCEYVFSSASESRRHGVPHGGVRCSECLADITGFRYKCVSCPDYNLCGACEALGVHEQHMMMRISRPLKSKHASLLVQRWCKAMKSTGVATLDDLCEPAPAPAFSAGDAGERGDSAQADPAISYQVLSHQPITVKQEPMDEDDTETPSTSKIATKPKCRVEPAKRSANISIVVSNEDEGVPRKKTATTKIKEEKEAESSEEQILADYYEGFEESESEVDIDEVKLEVEDPLSSEIIVEIPEQKYPKYIVKQGASEPRTHLSRGVTAPKTDSSQDISKPSSSK